jgi:outer membrane protein TolC
VRRSFAVLTLATFLGVLLSPREVEAAGSPSPSPVKKAQPVQPRPSPSQKKATNKPIQFNLPSYIKAVVGRDPTLIADRLAQMSSDEEIKSARASYLPQLTAHADLGVVDGSTNLHLFASPTVEATIRTPATETSPATKQTIKVPVEFRTINWGFFDLLGPTLTMPFFKDGTFLGINTPPAVNMKRAEGRILVQKSRLSEQEIIFRATEIYLRAIATNNDTEMLRQHLGLVLKQTEMVRERAKHDLVSPADKLLAETKLREATIEFETARELAIYSFSYVGQLVGIDDPRNFRIDSKHPEPQPLPTFDGLMLRNHTDHPLIALQQAAIDEAKADLALKHAKLWPSGEIRSSYRWGNDLETQGADRWISVLALSAPVFDFGELHYAAKASDLKWQEEKERLVKVNDELRRSIFEAFTDIQYAIEFQSRNTALVQERETTLKRLQELATYGRTPISELIVADLNLLEAKRARERSLFDLFHSYARLEKATAGEWKWIR